MLLQLYGVLQGITKQHTNRIIAEKSANTRFNGAFIG